MGTDKAVIFKFTSNSKHAHSPNNRLKINYFRSDVLTNNQACSKNMLSSQV